MVFLDPDFDAVVLVTVSRMASTKVEWALMWRLVACFGR